MGPQGKLVHVPAFLGEMLHSLNVSGGGLHQSGVAIVVNWCTDVGPATKLLPTLELETDPGTLIATVDDDVAYHRSMLQQLVAAMQQWPHCAYNYAGQIIEAVESRRGLRSEPGSISGAYAVRSADTDSYKTHPQAVDILEAFLGAIYRRDFFSDAVHEVDPLCVTTDDIWISQHLASRGIPRIRLPQQPSEQSTVLEALDSKGALRSNNVFGANRNVQCAVRHLETFRRWHSKRERPCPIKMQTILPISRNAWPMGSKFEGTRAWSPCSPHGSVGLSSSLLEQGRSINMGTSSLVSPLRNFILVVEAPGQLCLQPSAGSGSPTPSAPLCWDEYSSLDRSLDLRLRTGSFFFQFGEDGNLCMYRKRDHRSRQLMLWCYSGLLQDCAGGACYFSVTDGGELTVFKSTRAIWQRQFGNKRVTHFTSCKSAPIVIPRMIAGSVLQSCCSTLASRRGKYELLVTPIGEVCLVAANTTERSCLYILAQLNPKKKKAADWRSSFITLQEDGNLCIYKGTDTSDNQGFSWCLNGNRVRIRALSMCGNRMALCHLVVDDDSGPDPLVQLQRATDGAIVKSFMLRELESSLSNVCLSQEKLKLAAAPAYWPGTVWVGGVWEGGWKLSRGNILHSNAPNALHSGEHVGATASGSQQVQAELEVSVNQWGQLCTWSPRRREGVCMPNRKALEASTHRDTLLNSDFWAVLDANGVLRMYTEGSEGSIINPRVVWQVRLELCDRTPCAVTPSPGGLVVTAANRNYTLLQDCLGSSSVDINFAIANSSESLAEGSEQSWARGIFHCPRPRDQRGMRSARQELEAINMPSGGAALHEPGTVLVGGVWEGGRKYHHLSL